MIVLWVLLRDRQNNGSRFAPAQSSFAFLKLKPITATYSIKAMAKIISIYSFISTVSFLVQNVDFVCLVFQFHGWVIEGYRAFLEGTS